MGTLNGPPSKRGPKEWTAIAAHRYHVPFWLLWGVAGAESSWGKGGKNLFGLKSAAEGADVSDWHSASEQAAKTLWGLKQMYHSWALAVWHYSGGGYHIDWPKQLAHEKGYAT